ncbi:adhesion G protein-coupled receptor B2 [Trichonephila clavipes]|nr:adhesion G protein-coupled receptor B2 [Trichonephila clavipes]
MIPAYNKKRCAAVPFETGIHFRRKTDFLPEEDSTKSYSGFEPEPIRLQAEDNLVTLHFKYDFWHMTATAGSDIVQSGRPIFEDFFQHLWSYIGNNMANAVFQMVKSLWLIRIDQ